MIKRIKVFLLILLVVSLQTPLAAVVILAEQSQPVIARTPTVYDALLYNTQYSVQVVRNPKVASLDKDNLFVQALIENTRYSKLLDCLLTCELKNDRVTKFANQVLNATRESRKNFGKRKNAWWSHYKRHRNTWSKTQFPFVVNRSLLNVVALLTSSLTKFNSPDSLQKMLSHVNPSRGIQDVQPILISTTINSLNDIRVLKHWLRSDPPAFFQEHQEQRTHSHLIRKMLQMEMTSPAAFQPFQETVLESFQEILDEEGIAEISMQLIRGCLVDPPQIKAVASVTKVMKYMTPYAVLGALVSCQAREAQQIERFAQGFSEYFERSFQSIGIAYRFYSFHTLMRLHFIYEIPSSFLGRNGYITNQHIGVVLDLFEKYFLFNGSPELKQALLSVLAERSRGDIKKIEGYLRIIEDYGWRLSSARMNHKEYAILITHLLELGLLELGLLELGLLKSKKLRVEKTLSLEEILDLDSKILKAHELARTYKKQGLIDPPASKFQRRLLKFFRLMRFY